MAANHGVHSVLEARVAKSAVPARLDPSAERADTLNIVVTDSSGNMLVEGSIPDPAVIHSPLPLPGEAPEGHHVVRLDATEYVIRLPYNSAMRYVNLTESDLPAPTPRIKTMSSSPESPARSTTTIDLAPVLLTRPQAGKE
jgi:hypothetical protein